MKRIIYIVLLVALITGGCSKNQSVIPGNKIIILNNIANTIDVYSIDNDSLYSDVIKTGDVPNDFVVKENTGYVINSGGFNGTPSITVVDLLDWEVVEEIPMPEGANPYSAVLVDKEIYITSYGKNMVYILNTESNKLSDSISVGKKPEGIIVDNSKFYVACTGINPDFTYGDGYVYIIENKSVIDSIKVGTNPQYLVKGDNGIYVVCTGNYADIKGKMYLIDEQTFTVKDSIEIGGTPAYAVKKDKDIYITDYSGFVYVLNEDTKETKNIETGNGTTGITYGDNKFWITVSPYNETNYLKSIKDETVSDEMELGKKGAGFLFYTED